MDAASRLAIARAEAIRSPRTLLIGFAPEVADATAAAAIHHLDLVSHHADPRSRFGPWLDDAEPFDIAAIRLPDAVARLRMLLAMAASAVRPGGRVCVIGRNDEGARTAGKHMTELVGPAETIDTRFHCRMLASIVERAERRVLTDFRETYRVGDHTIVSYPGVFAHGRLDEGTERLLRVLDVPAGARALDVGCGAGGVTAWLAARGAETDAVDVDALALRSTEETLAANGLLGRVVASDVYGAVDGSYTHIVSNPPFHAGGRRTTEPARRLIEEAPAHLERGGELWIVANRILPYADPLERAFGRFDVVFEDNRFRVYRARR